MGYLLGYLMVFFFWDLMGILMDNWLVVSTYPLKNMSSSNGMMKFPTEWKNKIHVPKHQPDHDSTGKMLIHNLNDLGLPPFGAPKSPSRPQKDCDPVN